MKIHTNAALDDAREARVIYKQLEDIGYDGGLALESKHDPFLALAVAAEHTRTLRLGTGIAVAFARNPMNLANLGYDMQAISGGRFMLGLGSQIKPHIEKRFSSTWSHPAEQAAQYHPRRHHRFGGGCGSCILHRIPRHQREDH